MDDYVKLYKKAVHIQHKVSHLAANLAVRSANKQIPAPERERLQKIADKLFDLAKMRLDPPEGI